MTKRNEQELTQQEKHMRELLKEKGDWEWGQPLQDAAKFAKLGLKTGCRGPRTPEAKDQCALRPTTRWLQKERHRKGWKEHFWDWKEYHEAEP